MTPSAARSAEATGRQLGRLLSRGRVGPFVWLELEIPGWRPGRPGQFAMLQHMTSSHFLPRPLSIHYQRGERVTFLVSYVGPGTRELTEARVDDAIWVLGPLGRGFDLAAMAAAAQAAGREHAPSASTLPRLVVVAGGVGIAPFVHLLRELVFTDPDTGESEDAGLGFGEVLVLLGFRDEAQAEAAGLFNPPLWALEEAGLPARRVVATEDGSLGTCGVVTALLVEELRAGDAIASCGAHGMCAAAWHAAQAMPGVRTWFSLEAPMACGVGSCQGCVVEAADGGLVKVCRRGPVFAGEEVFRPGEHAPCGLEGAE